MTKDYKWLLAGLIVIITFITYIPALKNDFTNWDEPEYVTENKSLAKPIPEAIKYFFEPHYFVANYIPLTMLVYSLEYHLDTRYKMQDTRHKISENNNLKVGINPFLFHLVNILIHLLNVLLVFWFIYLLCENYSRDIACYVSCFVSLFFGIHPMHVESVAWIAELKDVLYTFFFLCGLIAYLKYIRPRRFIKPARFNKQTIIYYSLTFVLFLLSVLSKPAAVVFPLVLILIDYYIGRYSTFNIKHLKLLEKAPFFIVSLILGIVTIKAQHEAFNVSYTIFQKLLFASYSTLDYIFKLFLPINLSAVYPFPNYVNGHLPYMFYIAPFIILLIVYGIYIAWRKTSKVSKTFEVLAFGFLFFLVNIALVLQIITVGNCLMADRYTYVPYIGLLFIIALVITKPFPKFKTLEKLRYLFIIILAIPCCYLTYSRCQDWKNSDALWDDVLNKYPGVPIALNNKGMVFYVNDKYPEAIKYYNEAIESQPNYSLAYFNLADCYYAMQDFDNELKYIDFGLKYAPDNFKALNNKGGILGQKGQNKEAMELFQKVIKLKPDYSKVYINLANYYDAQKDYNNELKNLDIALKLEPDDPVAVNNKGFYLFNRAKYKEAIELYKEAIELKPDYSKAYANLADCYKAMHDTDNELKYIEIARKLAPKSPVDLNDGGFYFMKQGKYNEAKKFLKDAIKLKPDYSKAYINLGDCYKALHDYDSALVIIDIGLKNLPEDYNLLTNKGVILYTQAKYIPAIELFKQAIKLNPEYADPYMNIGSCYGMLKDYDKAIFYWKKTLELNPGNTGVYKMIGWAYHNKGDNISAGTYITKAKEIEKK